LVLIESQSTAQRSILMTAANRSPHAQADNPQLNGARFHLQSELLMGMAIAVVITAAHLMVGWYNGRGVRPLALAGFVFWIATAFGLGARRRWVRARRPELAAGRWKFSFVELLMLFTGLTLFFGFSVADYQESQRYRREQETLQKSSATLLGPDGRIGFEADGSLMISICDRSFDDNRLTQLDALIDDWKHDIGVSRLIFGTGATTGGTPPAWPGVTDRSVAMLLQWDELEWLSLYGTAISKNGRERLLALPRLNKFSRGGLEK
jgi:hypothetical protein